MGQCPLSAPHSSWLWGQGQGQREMEMGLLVKKMCGVFGGRAGGKRGIQGSVFNPPPVLPQV